MKNLPIRLMATLTGAPRYRPPSNWHNQSIISNIYRLCEKIFGRRVGIRRSMVTSVLVLPDGSVRCHQAFYCLEAFLVHYEVTLYKTIYRLWKGILPDFSNVRISIPILVVPGVPFPLPSSAYLFAVAFDQVTNNASGSGTTITTSSVTATGSNINMTVAFRIGGATPNYPSSVVFNGDSTNLVARAQVNNITNNVIWDNVVAASSGTVKLTMGADIGGTGQGSVATYTGAGVSEASNTNSSGGVTDLTVSVTTVANNSWMVLESGNAGSGNLSTSTNSTQRNAPSAGCIYCEHTSNPLSIGSQSMTMHNSASATIELAASSIPVAVAANTFAPWQMWNF